MVMSVGLNQDLGLGQGRGQVVRIMHMANWHTYRVLTKRVERCATLLQTKLAKAAIEPHTLQGDVGCQSKLPERAL